MRIGINSLFLIPSEVGGSEIYLVELLRALVDQYPDMEFVIFTNNENHSLFAKLFEANPQVELAPLKFNARSRVARILREQTQLPLMARSYKLDLLFSPGYTAPIFTKIPQVLVILDMQYKSYPEDFTWLAVLVTDCLIVLGSKRCNGFIAPSEFSKKEILRFTSIAVEDIYVSHLGVSSDFECDRMSHTTSSVLQRLHDPQKPYLLCVAWSYPHKNLPLLIRAFNNLSERIPHQLILVGGQGRGEKELQTCWNQLPKNRAVRFSGLMLQELVDLYHNASAFVLPSLYEGFGLPVLEAMKMGTPTLTTQCGSIPEVAQDGVLYFKEDSLEDLQSQLEKIVMLSQEEKQQLKKRAILRAQEFTWQKTAKKTYQCFEAVVKKTSIKI